MARVGVCVGARHMRTRLRAARLWAGSSGGGELSPGGGSTERRSDTSRRILLKRVGEHAVNGPAEGLLAGLPVAAQSTANSHIDNLVVAEIPI